MKVIRFIYQLFTSRFQASSIPHPRFRSEMKIPGGIVKKLEKQRGGIGYILTDIEKEFGLKVDYARKKHLTIYGPHLDILELAVQTLIHRYVIKSPPENGVLGQLQGQNAVWRFIGTYAKKVVHLFAKDLRRLKRIRTVNVKATPSKVNPTCLEILCSVRVVEIVKSQVEKLVGLVHNLFEKEVLVAPDREETIRVKRLLIEKNKSKEVLCIFDGNTRKLCVVGKSEIPILQVINEFQLWHRKHVKEEMMPEEYVSNHIDILFKTSLLMHVFTLLSYNMKLMKIKTGTFYKEWYKKGP